MGLSNYLELGLETSIQLPGLALQVTPITGRIARPVRSGRLQSPISHHAWYHDHPLWVALSHRGASSDSL